MGDIYNYNIYNPTSRGYNSTYNWWRGPPCV